MPNEKVYVPNDWDSVAATWNGETEKVVQYHKRKSQFVI